MKQNQLYLAMLATTVAIPALIVPVSQAEAHEVQANSFKDISVSSPYYNIIQEMQDTGVIRGYEDNTFRPNATLSRAHAATLISRALQINKITLKKISNFVQPKDLSIDSPYYNDIKMLMEAGLLETDYLGNVNPNKAITRGEMAKILTIAFNLEVKADYIFEDVLGSQYEEYVKALYSNNVTTGYEDNTFKLAGSLTRLHYVLFMHRAMNTDPSFVAKPIPAPTLVSAQKPTAKSEASGKATIKYSEWSYEDIIKKIPRPKGYVAGEHEKKNKQIAQSISGKNTIAPAIQIEKKAYENAFSSGSGIRTQEDYLKQVSETTRIPYQELIDIINWAIDTGKVYTEDKFSLYFDYRGGFIEYRGKSNRMPPESKALIKYSDWSREDIETRIPRPKGYVAGEHEKKNRAIVEEIMAANGHGFTSGVSIHKESRDKSAALYKGEFEELGWNFEELMRHHAYILRISFEEYVKIVNYVIETGEVYDGKDFSIWFNYEEGLLYETGVRWHTI
ncbi:S-layer homology domain-containing protein [Metasolibacillus meyeri]|uniref:S-layer homology domain-containing protein n=1 Tax=Metasolibacillus meyeri TaxID=1071052 RepID=A0AAW9NRR5_9BACL|nr:S-layer homology domain-containing protein [Metasolibacillus meyeri]MEC1178625.1 S-layer homology domain-containing protein [Metasolibacillus meyeri]